MNVYISVEFNKNFNSVKFLFYRELPYIQIYEQGDSQNYTYFEKKENSLPLRRHIENIFET